MAKRHDADSDSDWLNESARRSTGCEDDTLAFFTKSNDVSSYTPLVTDFGLAKRIDDDLSLTLTGAMLGTPAYMSPEQALGRSDLTLATDVYGIGAVLYTMITGLPPFDGNSPMEVAMKVREQAPRRIGFTVANVSADLETVCMKCLAKEPKDRYSTANEVAEDLRRFLDGHSITARRSGKFEQLLKWSRRNPAFAALTGAVAALLAICLRSRSTA